MKFRLSSTNNRISDAEEKKAYLDYGCVLSEAGDWVVGYPIIEIDSLEQLIELKEKFKSDIIINEGCCDEEGILTLEIYNDYRE